ncbi:class I SAM-dependent methyltransferase [Streptomyces albus subsp. chlorinus]|uniref:class I SAM-dependent methyltransferase n=1 Tax=Streptomyces albus TaxID=1888 RepID=UPI00156F297E|nr:class I SAM-dependent methyltransferase [Streptomyces albus]NSC25328.1 class I SAM-dependent methyltransferase [Streptomyces albus subsp. chlorinus]
MPFDHNDHYHRMLLRQVPPGCGTALDVGCGTGRFARRLAGRGIEVDAIDPSAKIIAEARALSGQTGDGAPPPGSPRYRQADVTAVGLPHARYDFISCLASLHHVPFDTVTSLRDALAPGGVLVVLGCYREQGLRDLVWSLAASPVNAAARLAVAAAERVRPHAAAGRGASEPPVAQPVMSLREIHREAPVLLPGCTIRRLLFWRYLLVFRDPG